MTILKVYTTQTWRDIRLDKRARIVEQPDFANEQLIRQQMEAVSKSSVIKTANTLVNDNVDYAAPDADSEVGDTLRLYFELANLDVGHFDIPDPKPGIFQATTGAGANTMKTYADLGITGEEAAAKSLIDYVLAGEILISDGETPIRYLEGKRL